VYTSPTFRTLPLGSSSPAAGRKFEGAAVTRDTAFVRRRSAISNTGVAYCLACCS
jgi:hypothetical protein